MVWRREWNHLKSSCWNQWWWMNDDECAKCQGSYDKGEERLCCPVCHKWYHKHCFLWVIYLIPFYYLIILLDYNNRSYYPMITCYIICYSLYFINVFMTIACLKSVRIRSYSGPHFPSFGLNTERYGVSLFTQCSELWLKFPLFHKRFPENTKFF